MADLLLDSQFGQEKWYRHAKALGGVWNVLLMTSANLVGFAIGVEGMKIMGKKILESWESEPSLSCRTRA